MKSGNSTNNIDHYLSKILNEPKSVFLTPCNEHEIKNLIKQLKNISSSGYDNISNILLKELGDVIPKPLTFIFNNSLEIRVFNADMKLADVIPLFKNGSHLLLMNYRPILLLLTISKLLEKLYYCCIYKFLDNNGAFFKSQYGFRKKRSCEHAITELVGEICKGLKNGKHTVALFLDLSKAFDTINHNILYQKLDKYGIRGLALSWLQSYLKEGKIRSKCSISSCAEPSLSDAFEINIRCLQGSCLGPLIFLILCNDIYLNLELCSSILFADDTTVYKSHSDLQYLTWCVQHDLELIADWFKANQLALSSSKSAGILFSNNKNAKINKIDIPGLSIKFVEHTKFLGVHIDCKLTWKVHP